MRGWGNHCRENGNQKKKILNRKRGGRSDRLESLGKIVPMGEEWKKRNSWLCVMYMDIKNDEQRAG